jgi:hypothetical protein
MFRKKSKQGVEKNYKTGKNGPRYLATFQRVKRELPEDFSNKESYSEQEIQDVIKLVKQMIEAIKKFPQHKEFINEHIVICVKELGNMRFTILADEGNVEFIEGEYEKSDPTLILPISVFNLKSMLQFTEDNIIDQEELFKIAHFLTIPVLKSFYDNKIMYLPGNKWKYKFDDFIQIEIVPEKPVLFKGRVLENKITVVNVDGQWLIFPGHQGDPDWRLTLSLQTATDLYLLGAIEAKKAGKNLIKLNKISKEFLKILDENVSYIRDDHQREFLKEIPDVEIKE